MGKSIEHARRELVLAGVDADSIVDYIDVIRAYEDTYTLEGWTRVNVLTLADLLYGKTLSPLTNDPNEWMEIGDRMWQSTRNAEAFSYDRGVTHYLLSERDIDPFSIHVTDSKRVDDAVEETTPSDG